MARLLETASPTEVPAAGDCQLDPGPTEVFQPSRGIPAAEGRALPSLLVLERGVPKGFSLLQTDSSHGRDMGSDPLGLTLHPGPGH